MDLLKRVVIKEEFVALTGDFKKAVILNQLIYWSQRIADFDRFIKEENERVSNNDMDIKSTPLQHGWIYKKAQDLSDETMLGLSKQTIGRIVDDLCKHNWIEKRRNPRYKWDKTYQYRVNLIKIANDLNKLGYTLQDYKINANKLIRDSNLELQEIEMEHYNNKNGTALPENTTEITKQRVKEHRVHSRKLSFQEYKNIILEVGTDIDMDVVNSMQYFTNYRNKSFNEIKYDYDTWNDLFNRWLNVEINGYDTEITYEDSIEAINKFFNTQFEGNEKGECDYSPVFYCSGDIKEMKLYDAKLY